MIDLTEKTIQLIDEIFSGKDNQIVIRLIKEECGSNLPFCENYTPKQMERIRFAAIKVSAGNLDEIISAIKLAHSDWRDLLVVAGFAHDPNGHEEWGNEILERK